MARHAVFYGWAMLTVAQAARDGRTAIATPLPHNPYHADIRLPTLAGEDREEQKRHPQELADVSGWRGRPDRGMGSGGGLKWIPFDTKNFGKRLIRSCQNVLAGTPTPKTRGLKRNAH